MSDHVLRIEDLHVEFKVYEGRLKVLNGVNMDVGPGARVGLVGEAGCGKTTTMRCVLGILQSPPGRITNGTILFHDRDVLKMSQANLQRMRGGGISMIFQDPVAALNPVFTIGDQLTSVIRYAVTKKMDNKEIKRRAIKALADVQLPDPDRMYTSYPVQLSGGMRQRVCIAMALATEPELMIADEPTTALDVTIQAQVLHLLNELVEARSTSIIFITHSLGVVKEMADWVYVMYAGNIVEGGRKETLFGNPLHPYTLGLMGALPKLTGGGIAEGIPGRIPDYLVHEIGTRRGRRNTVIELLKQVELPADYLFKSPHMLGGGERQMVAIARALATDPRLMILDEPTSALDVSIQAKIINMLCGFQEEMNLTYLFITHDLSLMRNVASRVAIMYLGKVYELAPTDEFFERPLQPYTKMLLSSIPVVLPEEEAIKPSLIVSEGEIPSPVNVPPGCGFHTRCPETVSYTCAEPITAEIADAGKE